MVIPREGIGATGARGVPGGNEDSEGYGLGSAGGRAGRPAARQFGITVADGGPRRPGRFPLRSVTARGHDKIIGDKIRKDLRWVSGDFGVEISPAAPVCSAFMAIALFVNSMSFIVLYSIGQILSTPWRFWNYTRVSVSARHCPTTRQPQRAHKVEPLNRSNGLPNGKPGRCPRLTRPRCDRLRAQRRKRKTKSLETKS